MGLFTEQLFPDNDSPSISKIPYKLEITEVADFNGDGCINLDDAEMLLREGDIVTRLKGDGDFRSEESIELLKEADIVVTNPPFSLFREYVAQLIEHEKKFLIIGNLNAITYKEFFPYIKNNKVWMGPSITSGDRKFYVPDDYELRAAGCGIDEKTGRKFIRVKGVRWFTNLDHKKRHDELDLYKKYSPDEYPKYDNYDAIEVSKVKEIPSDYFGVMGVPITFLDKYCPEQFDIVAFRKGDDGKDLVYTIRDEQAAVERETNPALLQDSYQAVLERIAPSSMAIPGMMNNPKDTMVNGKSRYARILIRQKK